MSRINWVAHNYIEGEQDNLIEETSATKKGQKHKRLKNRTLLPLPKSLLLFRLFLVRYMAQDRGPEGLK